MFLAKLRLHWESKVVITFSNILEYDNLTLDAACILVQPQNQQIIISQLIQDSLKPPQNVQSLGKFQHMPPNQHGFQPQQPHQPHQPHQTRLMHQMQHMYPPGTHQHQQSYDAHVGSSNNVQDMLNQLSASTQYLQTSMPPK